MSILREFQRIDKKLWKGEFRLSPIGEIAVEFREYTPGLLPVANVLLARILMTKLR